MNFSFHPEAEAEFLAAIEYYEECEQGLGFDFSVETYSAIQRILNFPQAWSLVDHDVRRCLLHRFPFGVLYSIESSEIFILAVMHLHREPDYWKRRQ